MHMQFSGLSPLTSLINLQSWLTFSFFFFANIIIIFARLALKIIFTAFYHHRLWEGRMQSWARPSRPNRRVLTNTNMKRRRRLFRSEQSSRSRSSTRRHDNFHFNGPPVRSKFVNMHERSQNLNPTALEPTAHCIQGLLWCLIFLAPRMLYACSTKVYRISMNTRH